MSPQQVEIHFPTKGQIESQAFVRQNGGGTYSSPRCQNVLAFEPRLGRNRGGSRWGTTKNCTDRVSGTSAVQEIVHVVGFEEGGDILLEDGTSLLLEDGTSFHLEDTMIAANSGRLLTVLAVAGGNVARREDATTFTTVTNGTSALSATPQQVQGVQYGLDAFFCDIDHYTYYDTSANAMVTWTATAPGVLPVDASGRGARLICRWRNRIVLAGLVADPFNWFMSAKDDPFDWDYGPTTPNVTMAIAGNNSDAGLVADIITALIPYTDDTLLIGGDHSIFRMAGDPAEGGRIELVSDIVGMAFGRAWCKSPEGTVYFFGSRGGVYRMDPVGGIPQNLTALTLDDRLADVNTDTNVIRLEWDDRNKGVLIFITPKDGSATTHYFWDIRNEAWWPITFTNDDHNPFAVHLLDGFDADDRVVLLGGQDGYVRQVDVDATADDGEPIESFVYIGPMNNLMVYEFQARMAKDSGPLSWGIVTAKDCETALESNREEVSGTFRAGHNNSQWPRRRINQGYLKLYATSPWALEELVATIEPDTPQRRRLV